MTWRGAIVCALLLVAAARAGAQPSIDPAGSPGSEITVTLVTFGQGAEVFERFGHDALWFHDASTGTDSAYHWGLFDFNEPHFVARFVSGDTRYSMGGMDARALIDAERRTGRTVTLQRLDLSPRQALALRTFVRWNALEENRYYRYDYYRDNCATRLRDALDRALGGVLKARFDREITPFTYRNESLRLTDGDRPAQLGIDLALGLPADRPLTVWESFFIPMRLRDALRGVSIPDAAGTAVPLVVTERTLPSLPGAVSTTELQGAPHLFWRYFLCGIILAALVVFLRIMMVTRRAAAWGLSLIAAAWWLMCGVLGVLIALAWVATRHVFWARNESLLLLAPFCVVLVILAPLSLLRGRAVRAARVAAVIVALSGLVAALVHFLPGGQDNGPLVALLLPMHLALAWALALPRRHGTNAL